MSDEFLSALEQILEDGNVPQETINRIAIAMAMDAANQLSNYKLDNQQELNDIKLQSQVDLTELKTLLEAQTKNIDKLSQTVARHDEYLMKHPPLLYLFRYRTRETIAIIVGLFVLLSLWWVSGLRQAILQFLGLPLF